MRSRFQENARRERRKDSFLLRLSPSLRERAMNFPFSNLLRNDNYGLLAMTVAGGGSVGALETKSHWTRSLTAANKQHTWPLYCSFMCFICDRVKRSSISQFYLLQVMRRVNCRNVGHRAYTLKLLVPLLLALSFTLMRPLQNAPRPAIDFHFQAVVDSVVVAAFSPLDVPLVGHC